MIKNTSIGSETFRRTYRRFGYIGCADCICTGGWRVWRLRKPSELTRIAPIDYEVHRLLHKRITEDNRVEYLVRWKGFNSDWDTWEPAGGLHQCGRKIANFEKNLEKNVELNLRLNTQNYAKRLVNRSKKMRKDAATVLAQTVKPGRKPGRPKQDPGRELKTVRKVSQKKASASVEQESSVLDDVFDSVLKGAGTKAEVKKASSKASPKKQTSSPKKQADVHQKQTDSLKKQAVVHKKQLVLENAEVGPKLKGKVGRPKKFNKVVGGKQLNALRFNNSFNKNRVKFGRLGRKNILNAGTDTSKQKQAETDKAKAALETSPESSAKRKYVKHNTQFWKVRSGLSPVEACDIDNNDTVSPVSDSKAQQVAADESSTKRKYVKHNTEFWKVRSKEKISSGLSPREACDIDNDDTVSPASDSKAQQVAADESSVKRKYVKHNAQFWKEKKSREKDSALSPGETGDKSPLISKVVPQQKTGGKTKEQKGEQREQEIIYVTPAGNSVKRKYIKRNTLFWDKRTPIKAPTENSLSSDATPLLETQNTTENQCVQKTSSGNKLTVKYGFKMSKKNPPVQRSQSDKSLLSLSENSKLIKHKRVFKSPTNKHKNQFKLSVTGLVNNNNNNNNNNIEGGNLKMKQVSSGKDGVKRKGPGRPPRVTVREMDEKEISDEEILYSLVQDQSSDTAQSVKERTKSDSGVRKEKKSPEPGQKRGRKHRSKSDGLDMARMSKKQKMRQKMRLLDSLKSTEAVAATVAAKPVRPVSPTPLYTTTVKPSAATATVLPSSPPVSPMQWAPESESPTEATRDDDQASLPLSPATMSYKVLLENLPQQLHPPKKGNKKAAGNRGATGNQQEESLEDVERRVSVRATECAFKYKEILIKKCNKYTQIWLNTHTKMKNSLNPLVMQEISSALSAAKYDDSNLVMLSGLGNVFCSGTDLHFLTSGDRRVAARQMGDALRDMIRKFTTFPKLIVAVVTGPAIGLGTAILPLCDIVYASDKATFYLPYGRLAQTPEGCSSYTLPQCCGTAMASELLIAGRKITAIEACQLGLVSQVYWPTSMMQEVIPRVQHMATLSGKACETTKLLIRSHQRTKLDLTNESECNLLVERWPTLDCQRAMEDFLCNEKNYTL